MIDWIGYINIVLSLISVVTMFLLVYLFRDYLNQEFYRWLIVAVIAMGSWSFLIISLDYVDNNFISGLVLCFFICTPITAAISYFIMAYEFTTKNKIPTNMYGLFLIPILLFLLALINPNNTVFAFDSAFTTELNSSSVPGKPSKIRFIINVVLGYALTLMSLGMVVSEIIRSEDYNTIYQGIILSSSIVSLCLLAGLRLLRFMPYGIDLSALGINLVLLLLILPRTKNMITKIQINGSEGKLSKISYPLLFINNNGEVGRINREAKEILEDSDIEPSSVPDVDRFSTQQGGEVRHYRVTSISTDEREYSGGKIYILSDVSELKGRLDNLQVAQQVSQRILRHNVRNKLTPIIGYADMVESSEYGEKISDSAESLAKTSTKAIELSQYILEPQVEQDSDITSRVKEVASRYDNHEISVSSKGTCFEATVPRNMDIILQECITNSIDHNDMDDITMTFDIEEKESKVVINYEDNGSGLPQSELEVLENMKETDTKHCTGCGLWMMKSIIESAGGEFRIRNSNGVRIQMTLDKA